MNQDAREKREIERLWRGIASAYPAKGPGRQALEGHGVYRVGS